MYALTHILAKYLFNQKFLFDTRLNYLPLGMLLSQDKLFSKFSGLNFLPKSKSRGMPLSLNTFILNLSRIF